MKRIAVVAVLLAGSAMLTLAGGCASTPVDLRQDKPFVTFDSAMAPAHVAQCLGRAAEAYPKLWAIDQFVARWREGPSQGNYEVLVSRAVSIPLLVADVAPSGSGSTVTIWQSSALAVAFDTDLGVEMANACTPRNLKIHEPALDPDPRRGLPNSGR